MWVLFSGKTGGFARDGRVRNSEPGSAYRGSLSRGEFKLEKPVSSFLPINVICSKLQWVFANMTDDKENRGQTQGKNADSSFVSVIQMSFGSSGKMQHHYFKKIYITIVESRRDHSASKRP